MYNLLIPSVRYYYPAEAIRLLFSWIVTFLFYHLDRTISQYGVLQLYLKTPRLTIPQAMPNTQAPSSVLRTAVEKYIYIA